MSSSPTSDSGTRSAVDTDAVPSPPPCNHRDSWLRIGAQVFLRFPLPGHPGHGRTAFVRRRPVRIVDGRMEGGYTDAYELICPSCGDHPYLDFDDVPAQLQRLRGSYVLAAAVAAYEEHLGLSSCPDEDSPGGSGPRDAKNGVPRAEAASGDSPSDTVSASTTV
jgi:hypothetical protein